MKKFSTLIIAALLLAGWSSGCADYLNTVPVDKSSPNTFLKGVEQAKSMLAGIYYCFYDDSPAYITPYTYENMCDNSYNHHTWEFSAEFAKARRPAASWWRIEMDKDWQAISRANSLIRSMALATGISPRTAGRYWPKRGSCARGSISTWCVSTAGCRWSTRIRRRRTPRARSSRR